MMSDTSLLDSFGRRIDYIRLSITDRCNFRCIYCMPESGEKFIPHKEILSYDEILRLCWLFAGLGVGTFKVTGGEPLARKGAVNFIRALKSLPGVKQVTLTSNGVLLAPYVEELARIGLGGLNISLNSLRPDNYRAISRAQAGPDEAVRAMDLAQRAGIKVKINVVPMRGRNEEDLEDLTRFALTRGYILRFIEVMPVGLGQTQQGIAPEKTKRMIEERFGRLTPVGERLGNGPAEHWRVEGYGGGVGFISALSDKFCVRCNRVRLTSTGFLKSCLHHNTGVELKPLLRLGADDAALVKAITEAVRQKPAAHAFAQDERKTPPFLMNSVGG
ncbi:MAG: GTP 3',8-cyclase MoaA [Desulfovibrio sp.]|nr:GTP 3',8-cyclase MoaA [Desulfovibrio sp.]